MTSADAAGILNQMQDAVPPRKTHLTPCQITQLLHLTKQLINAKPDAPAEYQRFLNIKHRHLPLPDLELDRRLNGAVVLVTGGTGCIGSTLIKQILRHNPARVVSVSRGITTGWPPQAGVEYAICDIRDYEHLEVITRWADPDIIFHCAAQHSPALAETEVHRTVTTNVLGTRNVLAAASETGVPQVVCASTGKALRPYSPEIYTASKRAAEWLISTASEDGLLVSASRFTHVIDNSIVHQRLQDPGDVIRLHSPNIVFYVQSALESAQLLLLAAAGADPDEFRVNAITDLGWPVSLLDVTLGVLASKRPLTPVYISGYDPGYEEVPFPGLYDPATAGDASPLMNSFETAALVKSPHPMVDVFNLTMKSDVSTVKLLDVLDEVCRRTQDPGEVRTALDDLSWSLLDAALKGVPAGVLHRCGTLISRHDGTMNTTHRRIAEAVRAHVSSASPEKDDHGKQPAQVG